MYLRVGALFTSVFYGIGIPSYFHRVLKRAKHADPATRLRLKDREFTERYGFMTTKMKEESPCYAWDVVILCRKGVLAVLTSIFSANPSAYYMLSLLVLVLSACAQQLWLPFALQDANLVESMTLLSNTLLLVIALARQESEQLAGSTAMDWAVRICDFFVAVTVVCTVVIICSRCFAGAWVVRKGKKMVQRLQDKEDSDLAEANKAMLQSKRKLRTLTADELRSKAQSVGIPDASIPDEMPEGSKAEKELVRLIMDEMEKRWMRDTVEGSRMWNAVGLSELACARTIGDDSPIPHKLVRLWAAKQLSDDDRDMIDMSKLQLAEAWAATDARVNVAEGMLVLKILRTFTDQVQPGHQRTNYTQKDKKLMGYFKEELRPTLIAWIAKPVILQQQIADARAELASGTGESAFLQRYIERQEESLSSHKSDLKMLESFINNLQTTDVKQNRAVFKKCFCKCGWCATSEWLPRKYKKFVRNLTQEGVSIQASFDYDANDQQMGPVGINAQPAGGAQFGLSRAASPDQVASLEPEAEPEEAW